MSDVLIEKLARAGYDVSQAELDAFEDDRSLGGWKALHYFLHKRITSVLKQGVLLYARHGVLYDRFDYFDVRETCAAIRGAGGYAVLAHPGEMIEPPTPYDLERALVRLRGCGLDGIECYYPTHTRDITDCCLRFCARHDMMITAGSDCHGAFGRARVGEMDIRLSRLNLRDLLERRQEEQ